MREALTDNEKDYTPEPTPKKAKTGKAHGSCEPSGNSRGRPADKFNLVSAIAMGFAEQKNTMKEIATALNSFKDLAAVHAKLAEQKIKTEELKALHLRVKAFSAAGLPIPPELIAALQEGFKK